MSRWPDHPIVDCTPNLQLLLLPARFLLRSTTRGRFLAGAAGAALRCRFFLSGGFLLCRFAGTIAGSALLLRAAFFLRGTLLARAAAGASCAATTAGFAASAGLSAEAAAAHSAAA